MDEQRGDIRFDGREWLGAFGDIGVLVPILISLAVVNGVDLGLALLVAGFSYIGSALYFRLPVPVQPLKAMAAIALAQGLGLNVIRAASLWMGVLFILLAWSGWIDKVSGFFPRAIVKGLQFGVGILLVKAAWKLMTVVPSASHFSWRAAPPLSTGDFWSALIVLVIPQIPLTLGNAVFGAHDALSVYYGERAQSASPKWLCASIGLMNLAAAIGHGYPLCHGSGGVTAHSRLGARTAGATLILGTLCVMLALFFGPDSYRILALIPRRMLGTLLAYVGICHGLLFLKLRAKQEKITALTMGLVTGVTGQLGWALVAGLILEMPKPYAVAWWNGMALKKVSA